MSVARWVWLEVRNRFVLALTVMVVLSGIGLWTYQHPLRAHNWLPNEEQQDFAEFAAEWHSHALIYLLLVACLSRSGVTRSRGLARQLLESLPISGRRWIALQGLVVLTLAAVLALASHASLAGLGWVLVNDATPLSQLALHAARWLAGAGCLFGVVVAVDCHQGRADGFAIFVSLLALMMLGDSGPFHVVVWPDDGHGLVQLLAALVAGTLGVTHVARRLDRPT